MAVLRRGGQMEGISQRPRVSLLRWKERADGPEPGCGKEGTWTTSGNQSWDELEIRRQRGYT